MLLQNFKTKISQIVKPSLIAGVSFFIIACSSSKESKPNVSLHDYTYMSEKDFSDHLGTLKQSFLSQPEIKIIPANNLMKNYFNDLTAEILGKNEIFYRKLNSAQITVLDTDVPLHFSLPGGEVFLSKGLITKYLKHESILVSIIAFELIKSEKNLYPKKSYIPTGYFSLERMVSLNRLSLEEKMELHKWTYYMTIRTGHSGDYYLSWLQTMNRNTADFVFLVGDINQIPREESLFKAFLIKNANEDIVVSKQGSSKEFYRVLNYLREIR